MHTLSGGTVVVCEAEDGALAVVAERDGMTALMSLDVATVARLRNRSRYPAMWRAARPHDTEGPC